MLKRFLRFFIPVTFYVFNIFLFCQRFLFKKFIENSIKKSEKHFWSHIDELI